MAREPLVKPSRKPHVELNEDLISELERSYYDETEIQIITGPSDLTDELIYQAQIFARRTKTSFTYRFGKHGGQDYMVFKLAPKRPYTKTNRTFWDSQ